MKRFLSRILRATVPINIAFFGLIMFALLVVLPGIPVEVFPNISFRQVQVTLRYPGRHMFHAHQTEFVELGWMSFFEVTG